MLEISQTQGSLSFVDYCFVVSERLPPQFPPLGPESDSRGGSEQEQFYKVESTTRDESPMDRVVRVMEAALHEAENMLDRSVDLPGVPPRLNLHCIQTLRRLSVKAGTLPSSCTITHESLEVIGMYPAAGGGYSDVWRGRLGSRQVAIKALRLRPEDGKRLVQKSFCQEFLIWKRLSHKNVVASLGINTTRFSLGIVSEWMHYGNITRYLSKNPGTDRPRLLLDVAHGLEYLHSYNILHGALKCANILVNEHCCACLADFGLSAIVHDPNLMPSQTSMMDVRIVMWEMFSGHVPCPGCRMDAAVIYRVLSNIRPKRPEEPTGRGLTDSLWKLTEECWHTDRNQRPLIAGVISRLSEECGIGFDIAFGPENGGQTREVQQKDDATIYLVARLGNLRRLQARASSPAKSNAPTNNYILGLTLSSVYETEGTQT
ncbi:kinase-like protein [Obba rivulosa]|uniref:Kinase-like protein n=1 Tax=Obba rivulosa TaxID=1052685 RepID=A0A8E2APS2_9APHY|nr:kinase-like protein [Obba rivulosa]